MNNLKVAVKVLTGVVLVLMLGASINAEAGLFGFGGTSWKEEVLLHDGSKIIVKRSVKRGGRHEIGQKPPFKEQKLVFTIPGTNQKVTWEDNYSEDLGSSSFLPMALEVLNSTAYLVTSPMGCLSYNKWGRPNPPYVVFRYQGKEWQRINLSELPPDMKVPNLIISSPDEKVEQSGQSFVSADRIKQMNEGFKQPEYQTILREPYPNAAGGCGAMIHTKDGWEGLGFFKRQLSCESCLKYCESKGVNPKDCPCKALFKEAE